ncbi:MAG: hypothetical protein R3324_02640 [Halobacteriales archaeon]|nr:hypothetical protein [Halobacteriales archaeon]
MDPQAESHMRSVVDTLIDTVRTDLTLNEEGRDYTDVLGERIEEADEDVTRQLLAGWTHAKDTEAAAAEVRRELEDRLAAAIGPNRLYRSGDALYRRGATNWRRRVKDAERFFAEAFAGDVEAARRADLLFNPNGVRKGGMVELKMDYDEHFDEEPSRYGVDVSKVDRTTFAVPRSEMGFGPREKA